MIFDLTSFSPFLPQVWRGETPVVIERDCWLNSSGGGKVVGDEVKSSLNSGLLAVLVVVSILAPFFMAVAVGIGLEVVWVSSWKVSLAAIEVGDRSIDDDGWWAWVRPPPLVLPVLMMMPEVDEGAWKVIKSYVKIFFEEKLLIDVCTCKWLCCCCSLEEGRRGWVWLWPRLGGGTVPCK